MGERSGTGNVTDMTALRGADDGCGNSRAFDRATGGLSAICEKLPVLLRKVPFVAAAAGVFEYE